MSYEQEFITETMRLSDEMGKASKPHLYGPNPFWDSLCRKHIQLVEKHGFDSFKRTINFEYHQWGVSSLGDDKIKCIGKYLVRHPLRLLSALMMAKADLTDVSDIRWPDEIDRTTGAANAGERVGNMPRAYVIYVSLLWQYACLVDRLGCLVACDEPTLGRPLPVMYRNRLISQDLALSTIELNLINRFADLKATRRMGEIGAGYGRMAYVATGVNPSLEYSIFDIPPAAAMSTIYLRATNRPNVTVSLPHLLEEVPDNYFEVFVNVSSFDEMSPQQVANYLSLIDRKLRGIVYVKGHTHTRSVGQRLGVTEFPYPARWKLLHSAADPVCPYFTERVYRVE